MENKKGTYIFALGGIDEIGKNMYIVEQGDDIFIIDCGVKFPNEKDHPGVDLIVAPNQYLIDNQDKIRGLIITHGHDDHIGGVPYLLKTVNIPKIYAAKLSWEIIKRKCSEHKDLADKLNNLVDFIDDNKKIETNEFKIDFFRVTHSIPDAFGVVFKTINGTIVSTGDFRFDFSPKGSDETDFAKLTSIGCNNVDVLLCESTNADTPGFSPSETNIIANIEKHIKQCPGRIIFSAFSSNLGRIEEVIGLAIKYKRKIVVLGRSMKNNIESAINIGFLSIDQSQMLEPRELKNDQHPDNEIMVLCTGSQGEEMAALNSIAQDKNINISLKPNDTIILSSNPIPGNFRSVENLLNKLYKKNIRVIQNSSVNNIHATGHATKQEQQLMFKLMNPMYLIPIHGESRMLQSLKISAIQAGIHEENVFQISNGEKLCLLNHKLSKTNEFVDASETYIEGGKINMNSGQLLSTRHKASLNGIFNISLVIDKKEKIVVDKPVIENRGTFHANSYRGLLDKIAYTIKEQVDSVLAKPNTSEEQIKKIATNLTDLFIWKNKKKHPLINVVIFYK